MTDMDFFRDQRLVPWPLYYKIKKVFVWSLIWVGQTKTGAVHSYFLPKSRVWTPYRPKAWKAATRTRKWTISWLTLVKQAYNGLNLCLWPQNWIRIQVQISIKHSLTSFLSWTQLLSHWLINENCICEHGECIRESVAHKTLLLHHPVIKQRIRMSVLL